MAKKSASGKRKNLLKNNSAEDGLEGWEVVLNGGDGWLVEDEPKGTKSLKGFGSIKHDKKCWATSHNRCEKRQLIDLKAEGVDGDDLDNHKPNIVVREWYAARNDCGCNYFITVRLLDGDKGELDKFEFTDSKPPGDDWFKKRHVFKGYPSGVRYIEFSHGGQDASSWAGHFGVKISHCAVFFGKKEKRKSRSADSSSSSSSSDEN